GSMGLRAVPGAPAGPPQPLDDLVELAQRLRRLLTHRNLLRGPGDHRGGPLHPSPWIPSPSIVPWSCGHGLAGPGQPPQLAQHPQEHILPFRVGRPPPRRGAGPGATGTPPPPRPAPPRAPAPRGAGGGPASPRQVSTACAPAATASS